MKEQTPLGRLIEKIKSYQDSIISQRKQKPKDKMFSEGVDAILTATTLIIIQAKELLPEERKVIIEAYDSEMHDENCGCGKCDYCIEFTSEPPITGEQYYETKFKQ